MNGRNDLYIYKQTNQGVFGVYKLNETPVLIKQALPSSNGRSEERTHEVIKRKPRC